MSSDDPSITDREGRPRLVKTTDSGEQLVSVDEVLGDPPAPRRAEYIGGDLIAEKYRLVRKLGEGGMGTVWVAHNQALDIFVAIKLIRGGGDATRQVGRLTQEARAAAKLGHPAIMRVFDFGTTQGGDPFIVMELLHGESLAAVLQRRGNLSETRAVQTLLPVVHALVAAHDKGIVHRDLKPENVFLARSDAGGIQPKLVDFGIAKLDHKKFERLTRVGSLLGSPAYMSPEQARGEDVDFSADVWAVSVVLYEMITGAPPFSGHNYNALLWSIIHDEPTPTCTQVGGDAALWGVLERGFQKSPAQRWQGMRQLGVALAQWLKDRGVGEDIAGGSLQSTWLRPLPSTADFLAAGPLAGADSPADEPSGDLALRPRVVVRPSPTSGAPEHMPTMAEGEAVTAGAERSGLTTDSVIPALESDPPRLQIPGGVIGVAATVLGGALLGGVILLWLAQAPNGSASPEPQSTTSPAGANHIGAGRGSEPGPSGADGEFAVSPFAGPAAQRQALHAAPSASAGASPRASARRGGKRASRSTKKLKNPFE